MRRGDSPSGTDLLLDELRYFLHIVGYTPDVELLYFINGTNSNCCVSSKSKTVLVCLTVERTHVLDLEIKTILLIFV